MKIIIKFLIFACSFLLYSQNELRAELMNDIEKNILIYRIGENNINLHECSYGKPIDFDRLLPSKNQMLNYSFIKSDLKYPNQSVVVYEIKTKFNFIEETNLKNDQVVTSDVKFYTSDKIDYSEVFLIGYNKTEEKVIYISGKFLKNCISHDFNLSDKNSKIFISFLDFKLFSNKITDIKFVRKKRKYLLFEGYSNVLLKKTYIKVDKNNFDSIIVEGY